MRYLPLFLIFSFMSLPAMAFQLPVKVSPDTIVLDFGNNTKIMVLVNSQKELEELKGYNLNKMIQDLSLSGDTLEQVIKVIRIKDIRENIVIDSLFIARPDTYGLVPGDTAIAPQDVVTVNIGKMNIRFWKAGHSIDIESQQPPRRTRTSFNIDIGKNNYLMNGNFPDADDALFTVRPLGSWYVGLNSIRKTNVSGPLFLEWGGGISWYNFKFQDPRARIDRQPGQIMFFEEVATEINPIRSKLTASYINLSLVPLLDFGYNRRTAKEFNQDSYASKGFRIGMGAYTGYRLGSKTKYVFTEEASKRKLKDRDNFYLNNWRYGLRLQIGYRGIDLFANYDLNELFINNRGPALNAFSFGITL